MIEFGSWTMQAFYIHISDNEEFNRYTAHYILFNEDYGDSWSALQAYTVYAGRIRPRELVSMYSALTK